ncbi:MAG: ATP synthase F1 subunit gamma [Treponema sp.]|nr:ATP synthase F1 subunit gamma [Treponema sp.]
MANLRDLRFRMRAIQQTLQVTRAMNLISTSKLRKGRRVLEDTVPFFTRIQKTMCDILAGAGGVRSPFLGTKVQPAGSPAGPGQVKRSAVLVITSDKGLAGGYNANIFREVNKLCENLSNPVLILTGAIGYRYFIHSSHLILENFSFRSRLPDMDSAREIAEFIIAQYLWGMFEETYIVYTHMYSTVKLLPSVLQILPLKKEKLQDEIAKLGLDKRVELQFEYLPSEEAVFDALVPMYIKGIIYGCLVEAYASEQSARMSAMDKATKSAQEMLDSLQLRYNRIRQAGITQEMTEIIGGSSVLQ